MRPRVSSARWWHSLPAAGFLLLPVTASHASEPGPGSCASSLGAYRKRIERLPMDKRAGPILEAIAASCFDEVPGLAKAAARAARVARPERARILGTAGGLELGVACQNLPWEEPANHRAPHCLRGIAQNASSTALLADIDSGTALFASALGEHLGRRKDPRVAALFNSFLLAVALEGEDLQKARVRTP